MLVGENIQRIHKEIGPEVSLVVVSKFRSISEIQSAYEAGQKIFAENRVQALLERRENLPADIQWHLIGHLQTNKVRAIAGFIDMIQSVDTLKLLAVINSEAAKVGRVIDCLLQIHVAEEETKFGFDKDEWIQLLKSGSLKNYPNVRLRGIMGMATHTDDQSKVAGEFQTLKKLFDEGKEILNSKDFDVLSMGMSGDYKLAVECGSTMVRVGSAVFEP